MRKILGVVLALSVALTLAACGSGEEEDPGTFRPVAYGQDERCYYLDEADLNLNGIPDEVDELRKDGLCQSAWAATYMPQWWLIAYAPYYFSPAYYDRYVPAPRRNLYRSRAGAFEKSHAGYIEAARTTTVWYNNKSKAIAHGDRFSYKTASFGSGNLRSGGFSSGMRCVSAPAEDRIEYEQVAQRSGGFSSGSRSTSTFSSGSRSSFSSPARTTSTRTNTPWKAPSFFGGNKSNTPKPRGCR